MRVALGIEYDGHPFAGWQMQTEANTIQACLESALSQIADEAVHVICAGRTDAGVHASGQVIHFDTTVTRVLKAWILGTNRMLPPSVAVHWAQEVDEGFHARFSALSRRYRYIILNDRIRSALLATRTTLHYNNLNAESMQLAAHYLLGEQDFSSFRSSRCESKTPMRNVTEVSIKREGPFIIMEIEANAFLHHMIRNIVGVLMQVGEGKKEPEWIKTVIQAKDRRAAAETAPAAGLYLTQVKYPPIFQLPVSHNTPVIVSGA